MSNSIVPQECKHLIVTEYTTGSMWFDGFEVMDDIEQHTFCTECGKELDGKDLRPDSERENMDCGYF